jgi:hypothetical protein
MIITVNTPKGNKATLEYTFKGVPLGRSAYTIGNVVKIQPGLEDDNGLLAHELCHVDQWYQYKLFTFRYKKFWKFRMKMESEAYAAQLLSGPDENNITEYSKLLSQNYNLGITEKEAATAILEAAKGIG